MKPSPRTICALLLAVCLAVSGLCTSLTTAVSASPDEGGRVPYRFHFETLHTTNAGGTVIQVLRDQRMELGESLEAAGWLATAEGVSAYQYLWLPAGGGTGEWITVKNPHIAPRKDLTAAGVEYPSGHSTAGFSLSMTPPEGTSEGYYDVYIRALDGMGTPCDLAALLNLRYGDPDLVSASGQTISIPRIEREGETSLLGGAVVDGGQLRIPPDGRVKLGNLNLASFETVKISYLFPDADAVKGDKTSILGLKSGGEYSYGKDNESYNTTDDLAYAPLNARSGEVILNLDTCGESGEIWLTGHLNGDILISGVEFVANGYTGSRTAAHINLSGDLSGYLGGANRTGFTTVTDPALGDVLRLEVLEATNDPYVYFRAGDLLRENEITLDADEYKYMVLLYRADPANNTDRMNLYLCSGLITGPTEDCNRGVTLARDGKWHYLLVDLSEQANWDGIIHGWRFDYLSGDSNAGDRVDFASVQFVRTAKAARKLAEQDPLSKEPYKTGDPIVIKDMSEEQNEEDNGFVLDPDDTYEITEAPAEPPAEPSTDPLGGSASDSETTSGDTAADTDTDPEPTRKGCRSALTAPAVLFGPCLFTALFHKRKKSTP